MAKNIRKPACRQRWFPDIVVLQVAQVYQDRPPISFEASIIAAQQMSESSTSGARAAVAIAKANVLLQQMLMKGKIDGKVLPDDVIPLIAPVAIEYRPRKPKSPGK